MHFILTLIQQFKLNNTFSKSIDTNMKFKIVFLKEKKLTAMVTKVIFLLGTSTSIHQFIFWLPTQLSCCQIISHIALLNEAKSFGVTKALIEEKQIIINAI